MVFLALPQLFVKSSNSLFESSISTEEIINFHLKNKHRHAILTESQRIRHFPNFHYQARQKNLIPVLSLHFVWKNSSEWLFLPKNFEGYKSLLKFTLDVSWETTSWSDIVKIFISGDEDIRPWKSDDFFVANLETEKGVYVRENIFLFKDDYQFHSLLRAIKTQSLFQAEIELNAHLQNSYLIQPDYESKVWKQNLIHILKECSAYSLNCSEFDHKALCCSRERTEIINYCQNRLREYISKTDGYKLEQYFERLRKEIHLFDTKRYWNYCFIFFELMKFIQNTKILTSAGRGSACSSLIIFLLGITQVDPLKYELLFDRFLNYSSERIPDLDLDIESGRRSEVLSFLVNRFGKNSFVIPSIIKRVKNVNILAPMLEKVLIPEDWKKTSLINKLIGLPFSSQPHPSSLIVLPKNIDTNYLSAREEKNFDFPVSPFDYSIVNYLGLQKFDLLSSPYLDFISNCLEQIKEVTTHDIQLTNIPLDDIKTYELIGNSLTYGLFHLDGSAIKKILKQFKPKSIEELAQLISIIRPGINKHIFKFLNFSKKLVLNDTLQKITSTTRGVILYQEQIMQIISTYVNISLAESDKYRIALQKQKTQELEKLKLEFFKLAKQQGKAQSQIEKVWNFIWSFGSYSFNKSHAIAYALSAYQAAYLKSNFREIFYLEMIKRDGISDNLLLELLKLGYKISFSEKLENLTLLGNFNDREKSFIIGLNSLKRNAETIFNKLDNIRSKIKEEKFTDLNSLIFFLLSNEFTKEEILNLNYLNAFRKYFAEGQSALYLKRNWGYLFEKMIYGGASKQIEKKSLSENDISEFQLQRQKNLNINLKKLNLD